MTIEELGYKHRKIWIDCGENPSASSDLHTKFSIQFAIEVLEEIVKGHKEDIDQETSKLTEWGLGYRECSLDTLEGLSCKIQELKQYLDE